MTPTALIHTAVLLGLFVLAGGGYGGLYSAGKLWSRPSLVWASAACYLLAAMLAAAIVLITPLGPAWKIFIGLSAVAYAAIPPMTWHYLVRLHDRSESAA